MVQQIPALLRVQGLEIINRKHVITLLISRRYWVRDLTPCRWLHAWEGGCPDQHAWRAEPPTTQSAGQQTNQRPWPGG